MVPSMDNAPFSKIQCPSNDFIIEHLIVVSKYCAVHDLNHTYLHTSSSCTAALLPLSFTLLSQSYLNRLHLPTLQNRAHLCTHRLLSNSLKPMIWVWWPCGLGKNSQYAQSNHDLLFNPHVPHSESRCYLGLGNNVEKHPPWPAIQHFLITFSFLQEVIESRPQDFLCNVQYLTMRDPCIIGSFNG